MDLTFRRNTQAHVRECQDIHYENVVMNHVDSPMGPPISRSLFPCRYYLIDFESARRFSPDSSPSERSINGPPSRTHPNGEAAPEVYITTPHDPFAADVYQLGQLFLAQFAVRFLTSLPAECNRKL
jgi:hypothetical protein